jgi:hypothetical protein
MYGDALAAGYIADDGLSGNRIAAFGAIYEQIVTAFYFDRQVARGGHAALKRNGGRRRWRDAFLLRLIVLGELVRRGVLKHLARGEFSVAEAGVEVFDLAVTVFRGDTLELRFGDPVEVHTETRASFSRYFSPISMALTRSVVLMTCLILFLAREVLTMDSQSLLGRWFGCVMISTMSPLRSVYFNGTIRPLTLAPTQVLPTSEWMA